MRVKPIVEQRDWAEVPEEHQLRGWSGMALWLAGAGAIFAVSVIGGRGVSGGGGLEAMIAVCICFAVINPTLMMRLYGRSLERISHLFSTIGALVVWATVFWSGGAGSELGVLYFLPSFYDAYFNRPKQVLAHLLINSGLALSPLLYAGSLRGTQFAGRTAVLLIALWGLSAIINVRKQRLLAAELQSRREAARDSLTGALNLRSLRNEVLSVPLGPGSGVFVVDVDNFKAINSRYGHTGADRMLCAIVDALRSQLGQEDRIARIGGDEFVILARGYSPGQLEQLAEQCMLAAGGATAAAGFSGPEVACSIGVADWGLDGVELQELLAAADRRMFIIKQNSKAARGAASRRSAVAAEAVERAGDGPEALTVSSVAAPPPRLAAAEIAEGLRSEDARRRARRGRQRRDAIAAGATWIGATALMLLSVYAPGADRAHMRLNMILIATGGIGGPLLLLLALRFGRASRLISTVGSFPALAAGIYATGGTRSPLLPSALLAVTFAVYYLDTRAALLRVGAAIATISTPFIYAGGGERLSFVVVYAALANTALVLSGILLYCKRALEAAEQASRALALQDPLTGLPNRRAFYGSLEAAFDGEDQRPLAVAVIDLDNFKQVNDRHGHAAGDAALIAMAERLRSAVRPGDCVARIGGDEFAVIAPGVDFHVARALGERLVQSAEVAAQEVGLGDCEVSATVGYALRPHHGSEVDGLIEAADSALMRGKDAGKRRVTLAPAPALAQA